MAFINSTFHRLKTDKVLQRRLLWTLIIFLVVNFCVLLIDQTTKAVIFNGIKTGTPGPTVSDWIFIAFRSQFHNSTTFLDFIGADLPRWASLIINYVVLVFFLVLLVLAPTKLTAIAISIIVAGAIGNTFDASWLGGVRNVMFVPWSDHGTFNFADVFILIGSPLVAIAFIVNFFQKKK